MFDKPTTNIKGLHSAKAKNRLPVAFSNNEVGMVLAQLGAPYYLDACLLYGSGLRLRVLKASGNVYQF